MSEPRRFTRIMYVLPTGEIFEQLLEWGVRNLSPCISYDNVIYNAQYVPHAESPETLRCDLSHCFPPEGL
jgi:hypothetical protein